MDGWDVSQTVTPPRAPGGAKNINTNKRRVKWVCCQLASYAGMQLGNSSCEVWLKNTRPPATLGQCYTFFAVAKSIGVI